MSGVPSRDGRSASVLVSPPRDQTSISCAKPFIGTVWENGFLIFDTSTYSPLGDGVMLLKIAALPIVLFAPVIVLIDASWLAK